MTTLIQSVSDVNGATVVTPLYALRNISQNGTVTSSSVVTPSAITTLGLSATSASDSLTYDAISLLQSFSPTFSVSGLTPAQQQQLALALGLNANATSTDLTNAINALLTPANPANELVNVLVGGTTTAITSTANTTTNNTQAITENPFAGSTNQTVGTAPATTITPVAAPTTNTIPFTLENPDSVLQTLLSDVASHALITANQAAATYSVPGTVYQLSSGVDHTRQADLKGKLPDIRDTLNPVVRVAAVRGTLKRQT